MSNISRESTINFEAVNQQSTRQFNVLQECIILAAVGTLLTLFFWTDLWLGWSFVGGDVYAYFMPQKFYYAKHLREGVIPFWNNTTGHGYPILGESQTAALYPPNLMLYYFLDVVDAYNTSHLLHYIFTFVGTCLLAIHWGHRREVACFIGLVFVYGWFPVKRCLEWAIITGAYLPWLILCMDLWFVQRKRVWLIGVSLLLSLQLLAGHYNLAFISLLGMTCVAIARLCGLVPTPEEQLSSPVSGYRLKSSTLFIGAIVLGFSLAAIQLIPTLELKANSQRRELTGDYQPAYGHLPLWYLEQCILPWKWYSQANLDDQLQAKNWCTSPAGTNQVEAHFYLGLLPLALVISAFFSMVSKRKKAGWNTLMLCMAVLFFILASGLLMPVLSHLPGFGYFTGPGRYSMLSQLCLAMLAGVGLDQFCRLLPSKINILLVLLVSAGTFVDYCWVSDSIYYTITVEHAPFKRLKDSHLQQMLNSEPTMARVFGPSQNMLTLLGHSQTPTYLGIGPKEYWDETTALPQETKFYKQQVDQLNIFPGFPERQAWLQRAGVTHLLTFKPLEKGAWDCELMANAPDFFVNAIVGRGREPVYFYKLKQSRGRLSWLESQSNTAIKLLKHSPHEIIVETDSPRADTLVLTELDFPGWIVQVDGKQVECSKIDNMFRGVKLAAGQHHVVWLYQPASVFYGACVSATAFVILVGFAVTTTKQKSQVRD